MQVAHGLNLRFGHKNSNSVEKCKFVGHHLKAHKLALLPATYPDPAKNWQQ